ncbi:MAG: hypothetical protein OXG25_09455 [Gammaproteobacteria bacterium]|nr:hypothetical protein [Gammaproteobacteria bacterium]
MNEVVTGLLYTNQLFGEMNTPIGKVGDHFEPLTEDHLIGSNAHILEFIRSLFERPMRLVASGSGIEGLVSLADLQKLPARTALFSVVTGLELAMADRIGDAWKDCPNGWLSLLSDDRREAVEKRIAQAKQRDTFVNEIAYTQLADKATIVRKSKFLRGSNRELNNAFTAIGDLRNNLAHANDYAATESAAYEVSNTVNVMLRIVRELQTSTASAN